MKTCDFIFAAVCLVAWASETESIECSNGTFTMVNVAGTVSVQDMASNVTCSNGYSCFRVETNWTLGGFLSSQVLTQCYATTVCSFITCAQFTSILQQTGATVSHCALDCCETDYCNLTPLNTNTTVVTAGAKHYGGQAMLLSILAFSSIISVQF